MSTHNAVLLESHLKTLRLPTFVKEYVKAARQSGERGDSHESFLEHLAELEVNQRDSKASVRRLKQASFPVDKDLSDFDFTAVPRLNRKGCTSALARDHFDIMARRKWGRRSKTKGDGNGFPDNSSKIGV